MIETTNARRFLTKGSKNKYRSYGWVNTYRLLTPAGIKEMQDYLNSNNFADYILLVDNVESTRPQRTMGDIPEWFRPDSMFNSFDDNNHNNTFIFIIYNPFDKDGDKEVNIKQQLLNACKSFPTNSKTTILERIGE